MKVCRVLVGTLLLAAVALNFANVVGRYLFMQPIFWVEEAMVFIQVWSVLIGSVLVTHADKHLRMDGIARLAPPMMRHLLGELSLLLLGLMSILLAYVSLKIVIGMAESDQRSVALEIPMAIPYAALPVGFTLIALISWLKLARILRFGRSHAASGDSERTSQ